MGDRCAVYIICRKEDVQKINAIIFNHYTDAETLFANTETEVSEFAVQLEFAELNYAAEEQLQEMVRQKLLFCGWHGAGCSYPEGLFVSNGERLIQCLAVTGETGSLVNVHSDDTVDPDQLAQAQRYWEALQKTRNGFGVKDEG